MESTTHDRLTAAAGRRPPAVAVVLGSGLGGVAERIEPEVSCRFSEVPALAEPSVRGHDGRIILGEWAGRQVLVYAGRLHFYEGHSWDRVLLPTHFAARLGARTLILTNAAGGIREDLLPGTLMLVHEQLDWTKASRSDGRGRRRLCSTRLNEELKQTAANLGLAITEGSYAAVLGPNYETPAEIRALRSLGIDAVGMSAAREIEAGVELGLECAAISCITNRAAGLTPDALTHAEVLASSSRQAQGLGKLLESWLSA